MPIPGLPAALALILALAGPPPPPSALSQAQRRQEAQIHFSAGQDRMHAEEFEQAAREFKAAIGLDPGLVLAHYNLGQAYMALKAYPAAVQAYVGCREAIEDLGTLQQGDLLQRDHDIDDQIHELQDL